MNNLLILGGKLKKIETINKIFEGYEIRSVWDETVGDYFFSVVDIIGVLTDGRRDRKYWNEGRRME